MREDGVSGGPWGNNLTGSGFGKLRRDFKRSKGGRCLRSAHGAYSQVRAQMDTEGNML
jgi:hypothetical protein